MLNVLQCNSTFSIMRILRPTHEKIKERESVMPTKKTEEKKLAILFGTIDHFKMSADETKVVFKIDNTAFISPDIRAHLSGLQRIIIEDDPEVPTAFQKDSLLKN